MHKLQRFVNQLHNLEDYLLFSLVMGMLFFSVTQIFLRNIFDFGIVWAETLVRLMVLWTTMIAAMSAARSASHINIDLVERYTTGIKRKTILGSIQLLTAIVCLTLMYYSSIFLMYEFKDGTEAFATIPSWIFITIIPFSLFVMGIRYLIHSYLIFSEKN